MADDIKPYEIAVPESAIELLRKKLELATLPGETEFSDDPNLGAGLSDIKRLVGVWKDKYDWRGAEAKLNKFPQFTTNVSVEGHGGIQIHFIHQRSDDPGSIPLLFCHGWPGSFIEVTKLLPLLTAGPGKTFHVVAPSLPNYGFSQRTLKAGFKLPQYAETCHKLMLKLGYDKYVTQGGDLGFFITRAMALHYPDHVKATHMNFLLATPPGDETVSHTAEELAGLARTQDYRLNGAGYSTLQATAPHTPGFSLVDSPVGLLAWIHEKLRDWTDSYPWTDEEILTWVSIYFFSTAGPDASLRIYYEVVHATGVRDRDDTINAAYLQWINVKLGVSYFPKDVMVFPSSWGRTLGPVTFENRHTEGGHFAAYEKPELLSDDVKRMFGGKEFDTL